VSEKAVRAILIAGLAGFALFATRVERIAAPANFGGQALAQGFGRGRLDQAGIVAESPGGSLRLPAEIVRVTLELSGSADVRVSADGVARSAALTGSPLRLSFDLPRGGVVDIRSDARLRLLSIDLERPAPSWLPSLALLVASGGAVFLSLRVRSRSRAP
jgi:hypothetical protein